MSRLPVKIKSHILFCILFLLSVTMVKGETYYSYEGATTNEWHDPEIWTKDDGGDYVNPDDAIPSDGDIVIIKDNMNVVLTEDVTVADLVIKVESGSSLTIGTHKFTAGIAKLEGKGKVRISHSYFPSVTTNNFITEEGGTVEYYNFSGELPTSPTEYNHLLLNTTNDDDNNFILDNNLTLHGNLTLTRSSTSGSTGFTIGNSSDVRNLIINGNVTVGENTNIGVGEFDVVHQVEITGDLMNHGTVDLTNSTSGAAEVIFTGKSNNSITGPGSTLNFYRLIVDKGDDQTFMLDINPVAFDLYYPTGQDDNKALWIRNGTVKLGPNINILELTGGGKNYYIPQSGALWIDGATVDITNASAGTSNTGLTVIGKLKITSGTLNGGNGPGIQYESTTGQILIQGGEVNISQVRPSNVAGTHYAAYNQSGGTVNIDGSGNTDDDYARLSLVNSNNNFNMSGGTLNIENPTTTGILAIGSGEGYYNVSGGDVEIHIPTGTEDVALCSTSPFYNLDIYKDGEEAGGLSLESISGIGSQPLTIYGNLTLRAYVRLISNDLNVSLGGDFTLENGASYAHGTNTTEFIARGTSTATITNNGTTPLTFNHVSLNKSDDVASYNHAKTVIFPSSGSPGVNILGSLSFNSVYQTLNLNNASLRIQGNVNVNRESRILNDNGILLQPATAAEQNLDIGKLSTANSFELDNSAGAELTEDAAMENLTLTSGSLYIGNNDLMLNNPVVDGGSGFDENSMVSTNGFSGELIYNMNGRGGGTYLYPVGAGAKLPGGEELFEWEEDFSTDVIANGDWTSTTVNGGTTDWIVDNGSEYVKFDGQANESARLVTPSIDLSGYSEITLTFREQRPQVSAGAGAPDQDELVVQYNTGSGWVTLETYSNQQDAFAERTISLPSECFVAGCQIGFRANGSSKDGTYTRVDDVQLTNLQGDNKYTPFTMDLSGSGNFGSGGNNIGIVPVNKVHPNVADGNEDGALNYYWKVNTNLNQSPDLTVNFRFDFLYEDRPTDPADKSGWYIYSDGTGDNPGSYTANDPEPCYIEFLDFGFTSADYTGATADAINPGQLASTYNSVQTGDWNVSTTWEDADGNNGVPSASDAAVINSGHTVTVTDNNAEASQLTILDGGVLDIGTTNGGTFSGLVGDGTIITSSPNLPSVDDDLAEFTESGNSTIEYTGTEYTINGTPDTYYNLVFSGSGTKTLPNVDLNIRNRLSVKGVPVLTSSDVDGDLYIDGLLNIDNSGNLTIQEGNNRTIEANHLNIGAGGTGGTFMVENAGTNTHQLTLQEGGIVSDASGSIDFHGNGGDHVCDVTLIGPGSTTIGNTNADLKLNRLIIDKDGLVDEVVVDAYLQLMGPTDGATKALELNNGTFIIKSEGDDPLDITLSSGNDPFYIPETAALISKGNPTNPNKLRISGGNGMLLDGLFSLSGNAQAVFNHNDTENYIQYSSSGNARIEVKDNAELHLGGQLRRDQSSGILDYYQTGGEVYIASQGASESTRGVFEVLNSGSAFTHTGGKLSIGMASDYAGGDIYLEPESHDIGSGATLTVEAGATNQNIGLRSNIPLNNLTIGGTNSPEVILNTHELTLNGDFTLQSGATFTSNDLDQTYKGDFTNNGAFQEGTSTSYFQGGTQTITGDGTEFYDLFIQPSNSVTLAGETNITVDRDLAILSGTLDDGGNYIDVIRDLYNNSVHVSSNSDAGGIRLSNTNGIEQIISTYTESAPTTEVAEFGRIEIDNSAGAVMMNDFIFNQDLTLTTGILNIQNRLLTLGVNSSITGAPFSNAKMIQSSGNAGDGGIKKYFSSDASFDFTYPMGVSGKFTPLTMNGVTLSQDSYITAFPVDTYHPTIVSGDPDRVLQYYWTVSSNIDEFSGEMVFNYDQSDVLGDESAYYSALLKPADDTWAKLSTGVDEGANTITFDYTGSNAVNADNFNGFYTAGEEDAIPDEIAVYKADQNGEWDIDENWDQPTSPPNGVIVEIPDGYEIDIQTDKKRPYRTQINGRLEISAATTFHNLGIVSGTGTLILNRAWLPPGDYSDFFSCSGGTIEYSGAGDYTITDDYLNLNNLIISGSGTKTLPDDNVTLCGNLDILETGNLEISGDRNLEIKGNVNKTSEAGLTANSGTRMIFSGTSNQTFSGVFTGEDGFHDLELDNSEGLTFASDAQAEIKNKLYLTSGILTTTNPLIISNVDGLATYSSSDYVRGPLSRKLPDIAEEYYYPVGKEGYYKLSALIDPSVADEYWTVEYFNDDPGNQEYTKDDDGISAVSQVEYWEIKGAPNENAKIQFSLTSTSDVAAATENLEDLRIVRWNTSNSEWEIVGNDVSITGDASSGTITTTDYVTFDGTTQKYTLATLTGDVLPSAGFTFTDTTVCSTELPIELEISLTGTPYWVVEYEIDGQTQTPLEIYDTDPNPYILTVSPADTTTYTITSVTDEDGTSAEGTIFNASVTVNVNQTPQPNIADTIPEVCYPNSIVLDASTSGIDYTYTWYMNGTEVGNDSETYEFTPSENPQNPNDDGYIEEDFQVDVDNSGCSDSDIQTVRVYRRPETGNQYYVPNDFDQ